MLSEINVLDFQAELGGHSHSIISQHYPFSSAHTLPKPPTGTQQIENSMHQRTHAVQFYSLLEPLLFIPPFHVLQIANNFCFCPYQGCESKAKAHLAKRAGNKIECTADIWQLTIRSLSWHYHLNMTYSSIALNSKCTFNLTINLPYSRYVYRNTKPSDKIILFHSKIDMKTCS